MHREVENHLIGSETLPKKKYEALKAPFLASVLFRALLSEQTFGHPTIRIGAGTSRDFSERAMRTRPTYLVIDDRSWIATPF
jgi:hypothetical protein